MARLILALLVVALVALPACKGLDPKLTGPAVFRVSDRHDAYVEADATLTDDQKKAAKQTTEFLRKTWKLAGYEPDDGTGGD